MISWYKTNIFQKITIRFNFALFAHNDNAFYMYTFYLVTCSYSANNIFIMCIHIQNTKQYINNILVLQKESRSWNYWTRLLGETPVDGYRDRYNGRDVIADLREDDMKWNETTSIRWVASWVATVVYEYFWEWPVFCLCLGVFDWNDLS